MRGVVLNETKTRIGQDFYDRYYYKYNEIGINAKKIVSIGEEFTFARNTKIIISIDNSIVYEFIARPDDEYLESVAQEAVEGTFYFFKELEKQSKYFIQY
ncbi:Curli assembly protein CsgE [Flavobacterium succinicans]|uniref:Curli production assembly/transport component CsgE n=1 Tax=Flavobacterium succinicans TaxID=29536 RepID=A0A1I4U6H1_9FLAO|nr:hypothetical protein BXU11_06625 [Flavobacterium sp. LM5]SFM84547.1 Curli assembly protein CsgE [Flavobacterium succinicans]